MANRRKGGHAAPRSTLDQNLAHSDNNMMSNIEALDNEPYILPISRGWVVLRYWLLSSIAVLVTLLCPRTMLWNQASFQVSKTIPIVLAYLLSLFCFWVVHSSDPGYLTAEMVDSVGQPDEISLVRHESSANDEKKSKDGDEDHRNQDEEAADATKESSRDTSLVEEDLAANHDSERGEDLLMSLSSLNDDDESHSYFRGTRRKHCSVCQFAPLIRSHHCRACNRCVACFDHHCHFIGTCIGERNHCRFWWFLLVQAIGFCTLAHVVGSSSLGISSLWRYQHVRESIFVLIIKFYLYPFTLLALIMLGSHSFFAVGNITTFECSKGTRHVDYLRGTSDTDLPFSKGLVPNMRLFCCQRDDCCQSSQPNWKPIVWQAPGKIVRDSEDWWNHPWQNKYWSCC